MPTVTAHPAGLPRSFGCSATCWLDIYQSNSARPRGESPLAREALPVGEALIVGMLRSSGCSLATTYVPTESNLGIVQQASTFRNL